MPRGGPRKNAGRKPGEGRLYGEPTKVMRVPATMLPIARRFLLLCAEVKTKHPSAFDSWLGRLLEAFTPREPEPPTNLAE